MPVRIQSVEAGSLAERLGWQAGDQIVTINGRAVADEIDFRFLTTEEQLEMQVRVAGMLQKVTVDKEAYEPFGIDLAEFRIRHCGDDCVFCFVDQNPTGLRDTLYFRDGDFRMSFLYGNYITMTNLRQRDLERIVEQRLSPLYISVHCTDDEIRRRMMGHRSQRDGLMEKLQFLREHGIEMHTQIVLVPGYNDGEALQRTITDLYAMNDQIESVSIVPVGLTKHRRELSELRGVTQAEARDLIDTVHAWQDTFHADSGRGFVYLGDEMYLLAGIDFPDEERYDGFPLMENGVGMSRDFLDELGFQAEEFPDALEEPRRLVMVSGTLTAPFLRERVAPALRTIDGLDVEIVTAENTLFGDSVTVSGLLSFKCFYKALQDVPPADLVLLPPDCVNFEGKFLDNKPGMNTPEELSAAIGMPVRVFGGDWLDVMEWLEAGAEVMA